MGFPGETEEDFEESLSVLDKASFNIVRAFAYEDRPGTSHDDTTGVSSVLYKSIDSIPAFFLFQAHSLSCFP